MVKQWGFVLIPQPTFDSAMRANFLIGYPFSVSTPVPPTPTPGVYTLDYDYLRFHLCDPATINQTSGAGTPVSYTYEDLEYLKKYL